MSSVTGVPQECWKPFEPIGENYHALLEWLLGRAESFRLYTNFGDPRPWERSRWREPIEALMARSIETRQVAQTETTYRPGGEQYPWTEYTFPYTEEVLGLLQCLPPSLYQWGADPQFPEDMCFYRSDGSLLLSSIGHEIDWMLHLNGPEERPEALIRLCHDREIRAWPILLKGDDSSLPPLVAGNAAAIMRLGHELSEGREIRLQSNDPRNAGMEPSNCVIRAVEEEVSPAWVETNSGETQLLMYEENLKWFGDCISEWTALLLTHKNSGPVYCFDPGTWESIMPPSFLWMGIDISHEILPLSPQSVLQSIELIPAYSLKQLP